MKATVQYYTFLLLGMAKGLTKKRGLAKFQLNCKRLAVSFFDRFFASRNHEFSAKQSRILDFFRLKASQDLRLRTLTF